MSTYETIASSSSLDIVVPDTTLEFFDGNGDGHSWLTKLKSEAIARKLAFFDEQLYFHLVLRLQHPDDDIPADPEHPPPILLSFLARTQVSYDASYISPLSHAPPPTVRLNAPPRSIGSTLKPHGHLPPSIVPPATPNPMPATAENDRRYMRSEGTPLTSGVWGEGSDQDGRSFALLWDSKLEVWTAVFRARIAVAFFQMPYRDPLLCITAHITVRDKPVPSTPARSPLDALVAAAGPPPGSPTDPTGDDAEAETQAFQRFYSGLEEVDLLSGLSGAGGSESTLLTLPSTRLGPDTRQAEYALRATQNAKEQDTPSPARVAPTVRKSFRRTLQTVSGVRLRRRTVLVPHVLVEDNAASSLEERAAGSAERTIVICVEIEHLGETASPFKIDAVRVDVGKETELSARARLVGDQFFPLKLSPFEQHNLLYAVELLGSPFGETDIIGGLQHTPLLPVSIHVDGRPVVTRDGVEIDPTAPFTSSWNTTLDVAPKRNRDSYNTDAQHSNISGMHDVLPEAPSPFPAPRTATSTTFPGSDAAKLHRGLMTTTSLTSRRLSAPVSSASPRPASRLQPSRASTGPGLPILREQPGDLGSRSPAYSPTPPSLAVAAYARTPMATTFAPPPTPGFGSSFGAPPPASLSLPPGETDEPFASSPPPVPLTPAYPAYAATSPLPGTPRLATPVGGASPSIGPTVDISRAGSVAQPLSPLPPQTGPISENAVVVSVGLLNDEVRIIRQDKFTLDILVFNRSRWTRRLEISMPPRVRRRFAGKTELVEPGVVPLENRVRVGPLRPSTCQSVRMSFLALKPGVHAVEALVLKDIETDWAMTLRSIIDIVVHEN